MNGHDTTTWFETRCQRRHDCDPVDGGRQVARADGRRGCARRPWCSSAAGDAVCRRLRLVRQPCQPVSTTPAESARSADAIIVLTGGQSRLDAALDLLEVRQGQAAADQRRASFRQPHASCRSRPAATRSCSPAASTSTTPRSTRSAMPRKAPNGSKATPMAASSSSPTITTCRAACWKWAGCCIDAELEPYPVVNTQSRQWRLADQAAGAAGAVHRIHQISSLALARAVVPLRLAGRGERRWSVEHPRTPSARLRLDRRRHGRSRHGFSFRRALV